MSERTRQEWEEATLSDEWAVDEYDNLLDCEGMVRVGGLEFAPSDVLRECDPIAYRCGFNDFADSMAQEAPDGDDEDDEDDTVEAYCPSCEETIEHDGRWCPDCGAILENEDD